MRNALRTTLLLVLPGALIAFGWARIETPSAPAGAVVWVAVLGLVPALLPRWWMRLTAGGIGLLLAVHTALRVSVLDARPFNGSHSFFGPLVTRFASGIGDYYDIALPFDGRQHVYMHGVALLAIFGGCFTVGLCVAARRPAASALVLLVWAAWPMTLLTGPGDLQRGAFVLGGVLLLLAAVRPAPGRRTGIALVVAALLVAVSLGVSTSPAVAKGQFLDWQNWDFYTRPDNPVGVAYVWDMSFDGVTFPKKETTVFKAKAPSVARYWRATTLDTFAAQRWFEGDLTPASPTTDGNRDVLTDDPLLPAAAKNQKNWVKQEVTNEALRDDHLMGATTPVAYDRGDLPSVLYQQSGVARASDVIARDQSYTVWSYAPEPTQKQLQASKPIYPSGMDRYLELEPGVNALSFSKVGTSRADLRTAGILAAAAVNGEVNAYLPVYRAAQRVAGNAATPYAATVAIEAWFRSNPAFTYNQHPRRATNVPPLVWFVTEGKSGYCQYYAGAMALMVRSLGIPARVAAGFTAGEYSAKKHTWTVTDHDAHMWVEVWFRGYGWLPFDPTPSRGTLGAPYSTASPAFVAGAGLLAVAKRLGLTGFDLKRRNEPGLDTGGPLSGLQADVPRKGGGGVTQVLTGASRNASLLRLLVLVVLGAAGLVVLLKLALRRGRYLTRNPRRIAAACRREVADFLADQRIAVERSATPHELAALVGAELGVDGRAFADAVSGARFGPPGQARESAQLARVERRRMLRSMRRELPRTRRFLGAFSLRSLGVAR